MGNRKTMLLLLVAGLATMIGCEEDERLAEMAQDATRRQAEQNQEMSRLNREVAQSHQRLLEADTESRQEVLQVQRELIERDEQGRQQLNALQRDTQTSIQRERSSMDRQHEEMDKERKEITKQRNRDPIIATAITSFGVILACLTPIALAICLLRTTHCHEPTDSELADLLLQEMVSDKPVLFGPLGQGPPCLGMIPSRPSYWPLPRAIFKRPSTLQRKPRPLGSHRANPCTRLEEISLSHIVTIATEIRDASAVRAACQRLGLETPVHGTAKLFSGQATGLIVKLPDWRYPAVCQLETGETRYDNYEGRWGEQQHLDQFLQGYAVEKAKLESRRKGYTCTEQQLADGSIKLTISVGGAA